MILIEEPKTGIIGNAKLTTIGDDKWLLVRGWSDADFVVGLTSSLADGSGRVWDLSNPGPDGQIAPPIGLTVRQNAWYGFVKVSDGTLWIEATDENGDSHRISVKIVTGTVASPIITLFNDAAYVDLDQTVDERTIKMSGTVDADVEWVEIVIDD